MNVEAIFFDLDNTLFDDEASIRLALAGVHSDICASLPGVDAPTLAKAYLLYSDAYWLTQPFARSNLNEVRRGLWRQALSDLGCDDLECAAMAAESYRRGRYEFAEVYDDTIEALERLHGRYRLAVITNGSGEAQRSRLALSGLDKYFEVVVASTDLNTGKPEPAIFHHVLERLGIQPAGAWHIGDSLIHDVAGAHNAGLTSVWLNRVEVVRDETHAVPHHEIASLTELSALLDAVR